MDKVTQNAINFVNLLTPGKFDEAKSWLSPTCTYEYNNVIFTGDEIIKCFSDNHDGALKKLDKIEYLDGTLEGADGSKVTVIVQDKIFINNHTYIHTDRLVITTNENVGSSSIEKIEHKPFPDGKEKLQNFLKSIGVEW